MQSHFLTIFSILPIILVSSSMALECYRSNTLVGVLPRGDRTCQIDTNFCMKISDGTNVYRNCDQLHMCDSLGERCVGGVNYAGKIGELCCCSGTHCNGAGSLKAYTSLFATTIMGTIICILRF